jgi:hypothetical protein
MSVAATHSQAARKRSSQRGLGAASSALSDQAAPDSAWSGGRGGREGGA